MPPDEWRALNHHALDVAVDGPFLEVGSYCGKSAVYLGAAAESRGRLLFALDHHYKLFSDGRFFDIAGSGFQEVPLNLSSLSKEAQAAREKLQAAIQRCMLPPLSVAAKVEVDAYGKPVQK
jgi:hypothetical protein